MATAIKPPFKIGQKVNITRTGTKFDSGRVHAIRETGRGTWYDVNVADKRNPQLCSYRAGDLQRA